MENIKKKIVESYAHYVQDRGLEPSMSQLIQAADVTDSEFQNYFNTMKGVRQGTWEYFVDATVERVQGEEVYISYTVREKMLSFCYTLLETIKPFRSYIQYTFKNHINWMSLGKPDFLVSFHRAFEPFGMELIGEGMDTGEVASRPIISDQYGKVLQGLAEFSVLFWMKDDSPEQEITDTAIEKSVNFALDFMAQGVFDSGFDLSKFLLQYGWEKLSNKMK